MDFIFKRKAKGYHGTEDFWYALDNGYIDPRKMLELEHQVESLESAIKVVREFFNQAEFNGLIGEENNGS